MHVYYAFMCTYIYIYIYIYVYTYILFIYIYEPHPGHAPHTRDWQGGQAAAPQQAPCHHALRSSISCYAYLHEGLVGFIAATVTFVVVITVIYLNAVGAACHGRVRVETVAETARLPAAESGKSPCRAPQASARPPARAGAKSRDAGGEREGWWTAFAWLETSAGEIVSRDSV